MQILVFPGILVILGTIFLSLKDFSYYSHYSNYFISAKKSLCSNISFNRYFLNPILITEKVFNHLIPIFPDEENFRASFFNLFCHY